MSPGWRYAITFSIGLLCGAACAAVVIGTHWRRNFASWYILQVGDQANVATDVLSGRGPELAERIQAALPAYVEALRGELADAPGTDWALWQIGDVYEAAGTPPPAELRALLDELPDRPSCRPPESRRTADGAPP